MRLIERVMPDNHNVFWVSDLHEGAKLQAEEYLELLVNLVLEDEHNYVAILGDLAEAILIDDKRYDPETIKPGKSRALEQYQSVKHVLAPIKDRILVILEGNHDRKLLKFGSFIENYVCCPTEGLGVPFGGYCAKVACVTSSGKLMYKNFMHHGFGSMNSAMEDPLQRDLAFKRGLKRKLRRKASDCVVMGMGHTHRRLIVDPVYELCLIDDGAAIKSFRHKTPQNANYIDPNHRYYVNTGSFLKTQGIGMSSYSEIAGYDPLECGFIMMQCRDRLVTGGHHISFDQEIDLFKLARI